MRRGVYHPHLYIVKDDGEPPLRLWALSMLIQDRADVLPSYQQFLSTLKDKVSFTILTCFVRPSWHMLLNANRFFVKVNGATGGY